MIDTTQNPHVIEVQGDRYSANVWRNEDGWSYAVRGGNGIMLCTGWTAGTKKDVLSEARKHLQETLAQERQQQ